MDERGPFPQRKEDRCLTVLSECGRTREKDLASTNIYVEPPRVPRQPIHLSHVPSARCPARQSNSRARRFQVS